MCAEKHDVKPNVFLSVLKNRCPRCRRGRLYQQKNVYKLSGFMRMPDHCSVCGQPFDMEPGFYYGTNMISYAIAVLLSILTFLLWWATIGFSLQDKRFLFWIIANAVFLVLLQPPLMRLSRSIWIYFFVPYSHNWSKGDIVERFSVNKDQSRNW